MQPAYIVLELPPLRMKDAFVQHLHGSMQNPSEFAAGALFSVGLYSYGVYSSEVIKSQFDFSYALDRF